MSGLPQRLAGQESRPVPPPGGAFVLEKESELPSLRHSGMVRRTRPQVRNCAPGNLEIPGSMLRIAPEMTMPHALNQPLASPVKEQYSPASVSAQDTMSTKLSSCTPLSPITCVNEIVDSTSAAASAQRGQFLRRCAASQTK